MWLIGGYLHVHIFRYHLGNVLVALWLSWVSVSAGLFRGWEVLGVSASVVLSRRCPGSLGVDESWYLLFPPFLFCGDPWLCLVW